MSRTVVHYTDSDAFGGAERALGHLLALQDRARWRPVLFHHGAAGIAPLLELAQSHDVELHRVPRMPGAVGGLRAMSFARALVRQNASVLHAHLTWALGCSWGLLAAVAARMPARVATVQLFRAHDGVALPPLQRAVVPRLVHRYIAVSDHVRRQLYTALRVAHGQVVTIPNGVPSCAAEQEGSDPKRAARERLFRAESRTIVLAVARVEAQKGIDRLIEAAASVEGVLFVIAGEGTLRAPLEAEVSARGLSDRIRFLGFRPDVSVLLRAADIFVLPSLHEGLPLAVLEAACAGTPVIASRIGGTDEVIEDGVHGLLFPPGDHAALASAIRRLREDDALARKLADAARKRVASEFTAAAAVARIESIYEEVLRG